MPFCILYLISDFLYLIVYHVVGYRKRVVRENLKNSFPDRSEKERREIERKFYHFLCDYFVETLKLGTISRKQMEKHIRFIGVEEMDAELERKPFVFLMLGHFGNWEWVSTFASCSKHHSAQLYTRLHNSFADRIFFKLRTRFGAENIEKHDALKRIISLKREGIPTHIGFIADQSPTPLATHLWMTFLNQETGVFTGAERIGKKVGAAAYFLSLSRPKRGYYECRLELLTHDIASMPEHEFPKLFMKKLEAEIQREPHLWLWTHRRWKHSRAEVERIQKREKGTAES
ncbi:MAG: lysophospholipid acyltransferase family protein [Alloprevotella sp.]